MYFYCEDCRRLWERTEEAECPACGSRNVGAPKPGDFCFLVEQEAMWNEMLAEVLEQNRIPFVRENVLGAGLTAKLGSAMSRTRLYVPFGWRDRALSLMEELFSPAEETNQ